MGNKPSKWFYVGIDRIFGQVGFRLRILYPDIRSCIIKFRTWQNIRYPAQPNISYSEHYRVYNTEVTQ